MKNVHVRYCHSFLTDIYYETYSLGFGISKWKRAPLTIQHTPEGLQSRYLILDHRYVLTTLNLALQQAWRVKQKSLHFFNFQKYFLSYLTAQLFAVGRAVQEWATFYGVTAINNASCLKTVFVFLEVSNASLPEFKSLWTKLWTQCASVLDPRAQLGRGHGGRVPLTFFQTVGI